MYQGTSRIKGALLLPVDRVYPDPDQPRQEFAADDLERLAGSLKERGQLQPIRVRADADGQRWVIIAGERRWRAAQLAGLTHVAAVEAQGRLSPEAILEDQLVENCLRVDLKPVEQARAYRSLMERLAINQQQLSARLNVRPSAVSEALSLLDLPEPVQQKVDAGLLAPSTAAVIARIDDPAEQERLAAETETAGLTTKEVRAALATKAAAAGKRPRREKPQTRRLEFEFDGVSIVITAADPDAPDAALEGALKRALAKLKSRTASAA